jgi:TonB family protein
MRRHVLYVATGLLLAMALTTPGPAAVPAPKAPSADEVAKLTSYAPKPKYPIEARARYRTGSGVFLLRIHGRTGRVKEVSVLHSTGTFLLDREAIDTLRDWRFKPEALRAYLDPHSASEEVIFSVPIDYTMQ